MVDWHQEFIDFLEWIAKREAPLNFNLSQCYRDGWYGGYASAQLDILEKGRKMLLADKADSTARQILAKLSETTVDDTIDNMTARIIFGKASKHGDETP